MTCPISCRITPSKIPSASMLTMSSMSNRMLPRKLMVRHALQIMSGPEEPRVFPGPSMVSSVALIRRRPAGSVEDPPQGTWVMISDHLHNGCFRLGDQIKPNSPYIYMYSETTMCNVTRVRYIHPDCEEQLHEWTEAHRASATMMRL